MRCMSINNANLSSKRSRGTLGESFTEVLVSILISALGLAILATAVGTALYISTTAKSSEAKRATCISAAESQLAAASIEENAETMTVSFGDSTIDPITFGASTSSSPTINAYLTDNDTTLVDPNGDYEPGFESLLVFKSE